jgi:heme exporter protein A
MATEPTRPAAAVEAVLEASGLVKEYGPVVAVDGIDLTLARGEFLTVFGPNGAGKSSLLRMLGGAMRPTRGTVAIGGTPLDFSDGEWRRRVGMLSHQGFLYPQLTAEENLVFYGRLFALDDVDVRVRRRQESCAACCRS